MISDLFAYNIHAGLLLSGWAKDCRFWLVSAHIQPQKDNVWHIGLPSTRNGYVCKPLKIKATGVAIVDSWIYIS